MAICDLNIQPGLLLGQGTPVQGDPHLERLIPLGIHHGVNCGGGESYAHVIFKCGALPGVLKGFRTVKPRALQIDLMILVAAGVLVIHHPFPTVIVFRVGDVPSTAGAVSEISPIKLAGEAEGRAPAGQRRSRGRDQGSTIGHVLKGCARFLQQLPYLLFRFPVFSFAEVGITDHAVFVYQIFSGPKPVAVSVPGGKVVVLSDGVRQSCLSGVGGHVFGDFLELKLRRVYSHDHQSISRISGIPILYIRKGADTIDAGVGPKIHQNDLTFETGQGQRR